MVIPKVPGLRSSSRPSLLPYQVSKTPQATRRDDSAVQSLADSCFPSQAVPQPMPQMAPPAEPEAVAFPAAVAEPMQSLAPEAELSNQLTSQQHAQSRQSLRQALPEKPLAQEPPSEPMEPYEMEASGGVDLSTSFPG